MTARLAFEVPAQPTDTTCGPTCLHAVYRYHGDDIALDTAIERTRELRMADLIGGLLRKYLTAGIPILTGLSSTWLYRTPRERPDSEFDDLHGEPVGHFVVLSGYYVSLLAAARGHRPLPEVTTSRTSSCAMARVFSTRSWIACCSRRWRRWNRRTMCCTPISAAARCSATRVEAIRPLALGEVPEAHSDLLAEVVGRLGLPCVLKQPDSVFSMGVVKVDDAAALKRAAQAMLERSEIIVA